MSKQQENMLLTEHFTWPPISLIDDIINAINEVLYRCTTILSTELSSLDPAILGFADRAAAEHRSFPPDQIDPDTGNPLYPEAKLEIEEGVLKLETLVENAVDKNFDKLEIWTLRNVFSLGRGTGTAAGEDGGLGEWIRLGHYDGISTTPPTNPHLTPSSLHALRRKLQETQKLHAALVAEKTRNEALIAQLRSLLQPPPTTRDFRSSGVSELAGVEGRQGGEARKKYDGMLAFLTHLPAAQALGVQGLPTSAQQPMSASTTQPLTTHTQFTTSQLAHLRSLLASLKPHLPSSSLQQSSSHHHHQQQQGARADLARERRLYVEAQSKRILEKRGVDTRDG
ncbi:uncharacterized protein EI97DRAFT_381053, partial [Westerdykella ornata]